MPVNLSVGKRYVVMGMSKAGMTPKVIARKLDIALSTVYYYFEEIRRSKWRPRDFSEVWETSIKGGEANVDIVRKRIRRSREGQSCPKTGNSWSGRSRGSGWTSWPENMSRIHVPLPWSACGALLMQRAGTSSASAPCRPARRNMSMKTIMLIDGFRRPLVKNKLVIPLL